MSSIQFSYLCDNQKFSPLKYIKYNPTRNKLFDNLSIRNLHSTLLNNPLIFIQLVSKTFALYPFKVA